jgi:cellulose synthase/poly-beta-1,6-N-acetylglucosamine synthase-like glycosyltransferase
VIAGGYSWHAGCFACGAKPKAAEISSVEEDVGCGRVLMGKLYIYIYIYIYIYTYTYIYVCIFINVLGVGESLWVSQYVWVHLDTKIDC